MSGDASNSPAPKGKSQAGSKGKDAAQSPASDPYSGKGDPLALPFDQYQRYRLVADLLGQLRKSGPRKTPLHVLDVGGRTALLRRFLLRDKITLVDMDPSKEAGLVLGDGGRLPFQDNAFDVVTAFDTLEHVPPEFREDFVSECQRVARKWVVLAGPYEAERVVEAEETLKRFLLDKLGVEHRYLNEHRTYGLPDRAAVERKLAGLGGRVTSIGHGNLDRWLVLMCVTMYMIDDPGLRDLATTFSRYYNASLYASDHADPVYRHLVIAAYGDAALPDAGEFLDTPVAPRGALGEFQEFAEGLMAFDQERAEWREERDRLRQVASDLEGDLVGHRKTLSEAQAEVSRLAEVKGEYESDLKGHRRTLAELELDLDGHRERLKTELDEADRLREVARDLEEDLTGHKDALGEARGELEARAAGLRDLQLEIERERRMGEESRKLLADDLAAHKQLLSEREGELGSLRATYDEAVASFQRQREDQAAVQDQLQSQLDEHRTVVAELRRQLDEHREVLAERDRQLAEVNDQASAVQAELSGELERQRAAADQLGSVIAQKDAGIADLVSEVMRLEGVAGEIQAELIAANARGDELGGQLAARHAELEQARSDLDQKRAELADRWGNLRRAVGRRRPPA